MSNQKPLLTQDQQCAQQAWKNVSALQDPDKVKRYTVLAKSTPSLIMNSGLMQTLAFLKGKKEDEHALLLKHLCHWMTKRFGGQQLRERRFPTEQDADFARVIIALQDAPSGVYMQAQREVMQLLRWTRQFADAHKSQINMNNKER